jgi:hypothetical protein
MKNIIRIKVNSGFFYEIYNFGDMQIRCIMKTMTQ